MGTCEMICSQLTLEHNEIIGPNRKKKRTIIQENEVDVSKNSQSINHSNHFLVSPQQKHQNTYNDFEIFNSDSNHVTTNNNNQVQKRNFIKSPIPDKQYFTIRKYTNGDKYKGYVINELLNSIGIYTSASTLTTYQGYFINNTMNGFGIEKWKNNSIYIGEYENNFKNGIGILSFGDGIEFKGEIKNNKANGVGRIDFLKEGISIEGEFINQALSGYGIYKDDTNDMIYEGEMKQNGEWNGAGLLIEKKAKIIYIGNWECSKLKGVFYTIENHKERKEVRSFKVSGQTIEEQYDKITQSMDALFSKVYDEFKEYLI